ncbi:MAG: SEC-C metal-binding domain-containing protein [Chlamydiales bacterium]
MSKKVNRNDPCPCGSGKKYKQCCLNKEREPVKTYTPSGKRKFKAKVLSTESMAKDLLGRMGHQQEAENKDRLKFLKTTENFEKKVEVKSEEASEPLKTSKFKKIPSKTPGQEFKPTDEDFQINSQ